MLEDGKDEQTIKKHFVDKHKASEKKASLAINVAKKEMDILNKIDYKNGYSLYIGIPFVQVYACTAHFHHMHLMRIRIMWTITLMHLLRR